MSLEEIIKVLLDSVHEKLDRFEQFDPDKEQFPEAVSKRNKRYFLDTPDGTFEIFPGDYIIQTLYNNHYYLKFRLEDQKEE